MRSIDADDVLAKIDALQDKRFKECGCPYDISVYEIVDIINACEMVDAVPVVHGHWIYKWNPYFKQELPYCSICEKVSPSVSKTDYCSHCGAMMDEVTE